MRKEKKKKKKRGGGNCYEKIRYDLIYSTERYEEEIKDLLLNRCFKIMDELEMYVMGRG